MTKLEQLTKRAVKRHAEDIGRTVLGVRHIYARAYVLVRPAPMCLVVACPPQDAEPHLKGTPGLGDGSNVIHIFDDDLKAGDWCSTAYVCSACGIGEQIAVPAVEPDQ